MNNIIAMVLAGGQGSRLNILSMKRAKPAVPFGGMYRIIDFALSNIMNSGIENVGILTQYKPASLMDHIGIGSPWGLVGRKRGAKILPPYQGEQDADWYKGTADAIWQNISFINRFNPKYILIASGDHIYKMEYSEMLSVHINKNAHLTIATKEVPLAEASRFGIMEVDKDDRIIGFEEKPTQPKSNLASLGIYIFTTSILIEELKKDAGDKSSSHDFGKDIIPKMLSSGYSVYSYRFNGYWKDVGTIDSYWSANMDLLDPNSGINLDEWKIRTNLDDRRMGDRPPIRFGKDAKITNSLVSQGCIINGKVTHSVLSPGVIVESGARVNDSILMHDVKISANSVLDSVIVDKDAIINSDTHIGYGEANLPNKEFPSHLSSGITVIGKGTIIPSGMKIGRNCIIYPDILESEFSNKEIKTGETIKKIGLYSKLSFE